MGTYSIAEAKDRLSSLVKQAEEGEDIAITRHGKVVAYWRPAAERAHRGPSPESSNSRSGQSRVRGLGRTPSTLSAGCETASGTDLPRRLGSDTPIDGGRAYDAGCRLAFQPQRDAQRQRPANLEVSAVVSRDLWPRAATECDRASAALRSCSRSGSSDRARLGAAGERRVPCLRRRSESDLTGTACDLLAALIESRTTMLRWPNRLVSGGGEGLCDHNHLGVTRPATPTGQTTTGWR